MLFLRYSGVLSGACIVRMFLMRDVHLRDLDLNLIHPLHALLEECHVTRASKRSFLSQSAMSRALERCICCPMIFASRLLRARPNT